MNRYSRATAWLLATTTGLCLAGAAQAEYFVRPVLQYEGGMQDGLSRNDLTSNSLGFYDSATALEAQVDLADGTIKTYVQMTGPSSSFGIATGVMGERIRYTGAEDVPVEFRYAYDASIFADQMFTGTPPESDSRYIGIQAHFAVYEAGAGATWDDWTLFGTQFDKALYVDYDIATFQDQGASFSLGYANSLGADLLLVSGRSYDIFAAFNLILSPGAMTGSVTMDALNTSTIGITPPAGSSFTSQSGTFLGLAQTPAVPEPASWAMMIGGFALVGAGLRQRRMAVRFA